MQCSHCLSSSLCLLMMIYLGPSPTEKRHFIRALTHSFPAHCHIQWTLLKMCSRWFIFLIHLYLFCGNRKILPLVESRNGSFLNAAGNAYSLCIHIITWIIILNLNSTQELRSCCLWQSWKKHLNAHLVNSYFVPKWSECMKQANKKLCWRKVSRHDFSFSHVFVSH